MKYTPKELTENVNVTKGNPLKDFFVILSGLLIIIGAVYFILGLTVDLIVPYISPEMEKGLGTVFTKAICQDRMDEESKNLRKLFDNFTPYLNETDKRLEYEICVVKSSDINALALPGGTIVIFSGLLEKAESDNEIAFVLAHELGHFHNRDHLNRFGRMIIMMFLSAIVTGNESSATDFIVNSSLTIEMKLSQEQEKAADMFAVTLLMKTFGEASGALKFMQKIADRNSPGKLPHYFASHPHPEIRVKNIEKTILKIKSGKK